MNTAEYIQTKNKIDRFHLWLGDRTSCLTEEVPADIRVTNEERSAVEIAEFCRDKPDRYFCYIDEEKGTATTFTGDVIGLVRFGDEFQCPAFGGWSTRQHIRINASNGCKYYGTYFKSCGDYARIRKFKG